MQKHYVCVILLCCFAVLFVCPACTLQSRDPTGITTTDWRLVRVIYLVKDGSDYRLESWNSFDSNPLQKLQNTFSARGTVVTDIFRVNLFNRIDIELSNGQRWVMSYSPSSNTMDAFNYYNSKLTYSFISVDTEFFDLLKDLIKEENDVDVQFEIDISQEENQDDFFDKIESAWDYKHNIWD